VLSFLGRKLNGNFLGDLATYQLDFSQMPKRLPGRRVKHRMKRNWMKLYNKEGAVLRVETVINDPTEFRIRRRVRRHGRAVMAWVPLRKGVAYLSRYQEICGQCNGRSRDALAHVDDPTPAIRALDALSARAATPDGRTVRPFNPVARQERTLFEVLMSGEHVLHGFTNRELREHLVRVGCPLAAEVAKQSGQVTRLLRRLHVHQLVAKIPRSRRRRVSLNGRRVMAAAVNGRQASGREHREEDAGRRRCRDASGEQGLRPVIEAADRASGHQHPRSTERRRRWRRRRSPRRTSAAGCDRSRIRSRRGS
jgi:hypothetical protein